MSIFTFATFDDGSGHGSQLYAGGDGPDGIHGVVKWSGTSWIPVGSVIEGVVRSLCVFDDGSGPALYAAGFFTSADGATANRIAKWDGTRWSALGAGMNAPVLALAVSGSDVYAGGFFTTAGGIPAPVSETSIQT